MAHKNASSVKTVDRLVEILDQFSPENSTWSLAELSSSLQLPKSTLHRFLVALECQGILRRDPGEKRWRLGYHLLAWGRFAYEGTELRHIAHSTMHDLVDATGETAILTIYHNLEVICIETIETRHPIRLTLSIGAHRPPHAGASSKILMAYLPDEEITAIIKQKGLPKLCTNTITDPQELRRELALIRERGIAQSLEETDVSAWGVAAPISDRNGSVLAGVGIAGPTSRRTEELTQRCVALCREASQKISRLLYTGSEVAD